MPQAKNKIVPHLWYTKEAEEAARFYASIFPDSSVDRVTSLPTDSPSGPAGSVVIVEFTLFGQRLTAFSAGPHDAFNDAVSFMVNCDSQAEIDRYWDAILQNGGKPQACGWIIDKYGLRWQIAPTVLGEMMNDPDRAKAKRVADELMKQVKYDIAALERAFEGKAA
jgi:predicted 3-demethylubiquinone-9 3-methyltransferase (glyoxalase superfamily)